MQVDPRHDHAFRVPRPDESVRFGTSNACNDCHADKDAAWAAAAVERWFGPERKGFQTWTETFAAARAGKPEAAALLLKLATSADAPSIARATALREPRRLSRAARRWRRPSAVSPTPTRWSGWRRCATLRPFPVAAELAAGQPPARRSGAGRAHRGRLAARRHAAGSRCRRTIASRLSRAIDDYVTAQRVNADRPEHRVNLGNLYLQQQRFADAEAEFNAARALDPGVHAGLRQPRPALCAAGPRRRRRAHPARGADAHARRRRPASRARPQPGPPAAHRRCAAGVGAAPPRSIRPTPATPTSTRSR